MAVLESEWKPSTAEGGGVELEFRLEGDLSRDRSVGISGGGEEVAAEGGGGGEAREGGKVSSLGEGGSGGEMEVEGGDKVVPLGEVKVEEEDVEGRREEGEGSVGVERDVNEGEGNETVEDGGVDTGKVVLTEGRMDDEVESGCQRANGEGAGEEGGGEVVDGEDLAAAGRLCGENEDRTEDGDVRVRETGCGHDSFGHNSNVPNCAYYVMTGKCLNGQHCKFNHPSLSKKNQTHHKKVFKEEKTKLEDEWSIQENVNCKTEFETAVNGVSEEQWIDSRDATRGNWMDTNHNSMEKTEIEDEWNIEENVKCKTELETWENGGLEEQRMDNHDRTRENMMDKTDHYCGRNREHKFSNQPDCVHYLNTGKCSYGDRCKFKHEKKQVYSIKADMKEEDNKGEQENGALKNGWESDRNGCWDQGKALKNEWESDGNGCWDQGNEVSKDGCESGEKVFWDDQHEAKVEDGWMEASEDYKIDNNAKEWTPDEGMTGQRGKRKDAFLYPRNPNVADCTYYMKTGTCAYGQNCRFNHPYKERESQHDQHHFDNGPRTRAMPQKEKFNHPYVERESQHDRPIHYNNEPRAQAIPQNGKFNHPYMEREKQYDRHIYSNNGPRTQATPRDASWEMDHRKWDHGHSGNQSTIAGRNGSREERGRQRTDEWKIERQKVYWEKEQKGWGIELESEPSYEYPSRPTEPDCTYYLQTGTCAYGSNCKFNHPSLRVQIQCNLAPVVRKYGSDYRHGYPEKPEEEPLELNSMGLPIRHGQRECPYYMQNGSCKFSVNCRFHHPDPNDMGENDHHLVQNGRSQYRNGYQESRASFPQGHGQSNCPYYMKNGTCKFGSGCKFYHPSDRESEDCLLSPIGLPLRPGQLVCTHYSQRGICKFGPACVYDHPMEQFSSRRG